MSQKNYFCSDGGSVVLRALFSGTLLRRLQSVNEVLTFSLWAIKEKLQYHLPCLRKLLELYGPMLMINSQCKSEQLRVFASPTSQYEY